MVCPFHTDDAYPCNVSDWFLQESEFLHAAGTNNQSTQGMDLCSSTLAAGLILFARRAIVQDLVTDILSQNQNSKERNCINQEGVLLQSFNPVLLIIKTRSPFSFENIAYKMGLQGSRLFQMIFQCSWFTHTKT